MSVAGMNKVTETHITSYSYDLVEPEIYMNNEYLTAVLVDISPCPGVEMLLGNYLDPEQRALKSEAPFADETRSIAPV